MLVIGHLYPPLWAGRARSVCGGAGLDEEELASRTAKVERQWACEEVASGHPLPVLQEPAVSVLGTLQRDARLRWSPFPSGIRGPASSESVPKYIFLATMIHSFNISLGSPYSVQGKVLGPGDMGGQHTGDELCSQGPIPGVADRE